MFKPTLIVFIFFAYLVACSSSEPTPLTVPLPKEANAKIVQTANSACLRAQVHALKWSESAQLIQIQGQWVDQGGRAEHWQCVFRNTTGEYAAFDGSGSIPLTNGPLPSEALPPNWPDSDEALLRSQFLGLLPIPVALMRLNAEGWYYESPFLRLRLNLKSGELRHV